MNKKMASPLLFYWLLSVVQVIAKHMRLDYHVLCSALHVSIFYLFFYGPHIQKAYIVFDQRLQ